MKRQAKKIRLVREVPPGEVISSEEALKNPWSTQSPLEVQWWLDGDIPKRVLEKAGIPHVYWGYRKVLEEFEAFSTPPGYRLFGANVPEILRGMGYEVEVVTKEELRRRLELSRAEMKSEMWEQKKFQSPTARRMEHLHKFAAMHGLKRLSIDDLVVFSLLRPFFRREPFSIPYKVWSWGETGRLYFGRSRVTGRLLLVLEYDVKSIVFADPDTFEAICEEHWQRITRNYDPHSLYFECLYEMLHPFRSDYLAKEFGRWVVERKAHLLGGLRRDYVVVAGCNPLIAEELQRICEKLGIEFRVSRNCHSAFRYGVFRKDCPPEYL